MIGKGLRRCLNIDDDLEIDPNYKPAQLSPLQGDQFQIKLSNIRTDPAAKQNQQQEINMGLGMNSVKVEGKMRIASNKGMPEMVG